MKIENMEGTNGRAIPNQFIIRGEGRLVFQSYNSVIVAIKPGEKVQLDRDKWDYSVTTGKYRNQFLGETKRETERKIKTGEYILVNLNK